MSVIIVTGCAGFIGSHLTKRLLDEGNKVLGIDNLVTTKDTRYIKDFMDLSNFKFLKADITEDIDKLRFKITVGLSKLGVSEFNGSVNYVYNLASPASVKLYTYNPVATLETSVIGVRNMLEITRQLGAPDVNFLETSTSEVYGDPLRHPQVESYRGNVSTQCERSCYDEGKRVAEVWCYLYRKLYNIKTHIARIFNTYGPNNTDDRVMPTFIMAAMQHKPLPIYGHGTQTRSFCYVSDTVDGLIRLNTKTDYQFPVNIGNPQEISILDLAAEINKLFGNHPGNYEFFELPECDPEVRRPDISLAKQLLNWEPKVSLTEGIELTSKYLKSCLVSQG